MGFAWVQDISLGAPANAAGLNEIQTNLDTIYATLGITRTGCASGAGWTEFPLAGGLVDPKLSLQPQQLRAATDYAYDNKCPAHDTGVQTGYKSGYNYGVDGSNYPGYDSTYRTSYENDENTGYLSNDHGTYKSGELAGVDSSYYPGYDSTYRTSYENDEHTGYDSGVDGGYYGPHNVGVLVNDDATVENGFELGVKTNWETNAWFGE